MIVAFGATAYTGLLFAQGLARDLWQGPHSTVDLVLLAAAEGSAAMLLSAVLAGGAAETIRFLALTLAFSATAHVSILILEHLLMPSPTLNHELAVRAVRSGVYQPALLARRLALAAWRAAADRPRVGDGILAR